MEMTLIILLTFFASSIGTLTGFGASTIMVPALLLFMPLPQTLLFVGIIHLFSDFWKIILFKKELKWRIVLIFGLPALVLSALGAYTSIYAPQDIVVRFLGGMLFAYVIFILFKPKFQLKPKTGNMLGGGASSGFLAGLSGIGGPLRSAFLIAYNLPKGAYIATVGAIGAMTDVSRLATYAVGGTVLPSSLWLWLIFLIPVSFAGAEAAKHLAIKIPEIYFREIVAVFLGIIAIKFLLF